MKCTICEKLFKTYGGLATHAARVHAFSIKQSYITFKLEGKAPACCYKDCNIEPYFMGGKIV